MHRRSAPPAPRSSARTFARPPSLPRCEPEEKKKKQLAIFIINKKNKFLGAKELLNNNHQDEYFHTLLNNKEPTFLLSKEKTGKDGQLLFSRTGWVYSDDGIFMVVINDTNEDPKKLVIINPIDTLSKKNKYSGVYC